MFGNTITTCREEPLYKNLIEASNNRFIELPKPPYDQIMAAVCFCKANSILDGKILVNELIDSFGWNFIKIFILVLFSCDKKK